MSRTPITLQLCRMNRGERMLLDALERRLIVCALPLGYTDYEIADFVRCHPDTVRKIRVSHGVRKYRTDHYVRRSIRPAA